MLHRCLFQSLVTGMKKKVRSIFSTCRNRLCSLWEWISYYQAIIENKEKLPPQCLFKKGYLDD